MSRATLLRLHYTYAAWTYFKADANVPINTSNIRTGLSEKLLDNSNFEDFVTLYEYGICENCFAVVNIGAWAKLLL